MIKPLTRAVSWVRSHGTEGMRAKLARTTSQPGAAPAADLAEALGSAFRKHYLYPHEAKALTKRLSLLVKAGITTPRDLEMIVNILHQNDSGKRGLGGKEILRSSRSTIFDFILPDSGLTVRYRKIDSFWDLSLSLDRIPTEKLSLVAGKRKIAFYSEKQYIIDDAAGNEFDDW